MVKPEHLQQVAPRPQALDRLWLKSDDKEFLGNIIRTHRGDKQFHPSIVSETTGSLKILLHGEPGTGKTLTAECLSEEFGVPLYTVNFGDLGVEPDVLGQRLEEAFLRAANWKAILLLDHAGTLIAKRHSNWTFHHNSSVSVFLRHLDHSKGLILITSTPSPLGLDPDFESRLNMLLPFPNFTFEAQKFVWRKLIDSLQGPDDFSKMPLIDFINNELPNLDDGAYAQMNGRQITNCFTAALFHAHGSINSDGNNLTSRHIKEILRLGKEFKDYLAQIEKKSDNRAMWWGS
ncbi:P-loop containing nucleoside triphosphate hydrolase protein [Cryphonectria parasitica EP155]|uniref:P-loop containing nucleoside triphosphate hydrolase protein n=1 Tax=Cryphonectria parasitica (strain ATCC 38755 / EP155) TaxID=660469 RepID=A0A9P4YBM6_CRYP1|nr:P-loop containing nucleoside triphosphate hydrolase protein [Cryphonectria parasitica EP155]KAF3770078.1 P-loop containing nucleoside triphosphate hydrolase protein [Cryphonectria parasitica EP155]